MIELTRNGQNGGSERVDIKIVGVGGAGSNALDRILLDGIGSAALVAMNTDVQALTGSVAASKVQLGRSVTRGLGAGGDPEVGVLAAEESVDEIRACIEDANLVLVCTGLGGGTGSGCAPLVARLAKERGALVIVFATLPFSFEGKRRRRQAEESLGVLQEIADIVICFENDRMGEAVLPRAGIHQAFASADQTISQSVRAVCDLIQKPGLIHIGFDDLAAALRNNNSRALFGFGIAEGENRAHEALERALKNPLMERGRMLAEAHNVLVSVTGGADMTLGEVQILMDQLNRHVDDQTRILFGVGVDPKMGKRMSVMLLSSVALGTAISFVMQREHETKLAVAPAIERAAEVPGAAPAAMWTRKDPPEPVLDAAAAVEPEAEVGQAAKHEESSLLGPEFAQRPEVDRAETQSSRRAAATVAVERPAAECEESRVAGDDGSKPSFERQETLQLEPVSRGRFEKSEPTIIDGEDLDVPTFLRRNVRIK